MSNQARVREIWTRLTVDPLADPVARRMASNSRVTPDRITALALALGVSAAACFAVGYLRLGGALFLLRFFCDCLDGKVARLQRSATTVGATFDIAVDVIGITVCFGALLWRLESAGAVPSGLAIALMGAVLIYNWSLSHRKHLAERAGLGSGGANFNTWKSSKPLVSKWLAVCKRLNMSPLPWAVEAEIMSLGISPLLFGESWIGKVLLVTTLFYFVACVVNLRRLNNISAELDRRQIVERNSQ